jgi:flagellar protein FlaG
MNGVIFHSSGYGVPSLTSPYESGAQIGKRSEPGAAQKAAEKEREKEAAPVTLETVAQALERYVPQDLPNTQLKIDHDKKADLYVYKAVDRDSGEVVRQYPADDILRFIAFYREREGLVVDSTA